MNDTVTHGLAHDRAALRELLRALLFVSGEAVTTATLRRAVNDEGLDGKQVRQALEDLAAEMEESSSGLCLTEVAGGWQLRTHARWAPWIRAYTARRPVRLSRSALECLAIVAYRQPATRLDVESVRGVDSGGPLRTLLDRGLLRILGRRDDPGRPMVYGTSPMFLQVFGLKGLSDLPSLKEFSELRPEDLPAKATEALERIFGDSEVVRLEDEDGTATEPDVPAVDGEEVDDVAVAEEVLDEAAVDDDRGDDQAVDHAAGEQAEAPAESESDPSGSGAPRDQAPDQEPVL
jgi:segregation and condensation protein B